MEPSWGVGRIWCLVAAWVDARRIWLRKRMQWVHLGWAAFRHKCKSR